MGRVRNLLRFSTRWIPWIASGAAATYRRLPENSQNEIKAVAKEPRKWSKSLESAWDSSKIGAEHFKITSGILANILIGRRVSKKEKIQAKEDLAALAQEARADGNEELVDKIEDQIKFQKIRIDVNR